MKWVITLLATCLVSIATLAQSAATTPEQTLQQQTIQAKSLYEKHAYAEAAAIIEKLSADPQITTLPEWINAFSSLPDYQALAGQSTQAILTIEKIVQLTNNLGFHFSADDLSKDDDLASLHNDPRYWELLARLAKNDAIWKKRAALWQDNPAIATPYKPVLTEEEKVAGLSKFWSEARFNFPFFVRVPDVDWDRLYMEYLPQVRAAQTTADYYRVMMRFAASLRDGHTNVYPPKELNDTFNGNVALGTQLVHDMVLVTGIYDPALAAQGIRVGAEILSIDGQPVREYAESAVAPYVSSSTPQDRNNRIYGYMLLRGPKDVPVRLTLQDESAKTLSVSVHRYCEPSSKCTWPGNERAQFKMLPGNVAYLAVNEFEDDLGAKTMRDNFATIAQATALIVDVRKNGGGSTNNGYEILSMLTDKPFQSSSQKMLDYKPSYRAWGGVPGWWRLPPREVGPDSVYLFSKRVVVLTSAKTFSAGEDFVVAFDAMHRGTLVGETTGGSTGQPLTFKLPGGGAARICTKADAYPDGRAFEGIGIPPQVQVSPSVSDVRQGIDAALNRAIEILLEPKPAY
jgi:C-terminal processing protease CtpA/Prc